MFRWNVRLSVLCVVLLCVVMVAGLYPRVSLAQAPVITVTKVDVTESQLGLYRFTLNVQIEDGGVEVFNRNYSTDYSLGQGQDPQANVEALLDDIQAEIDTYQTEQGYYDHVKFDNAVTYLAANLTY